MSLATPEILQTLPTPLVVTQDRSWWNGVTVEHVNIPSNYSLRYPAYDHFVICHFTAGKGQLIQKRDGKVHEGKALAGMSIIVPTGCEGDYEGEPIAPIILRVPSDLVSRAANEIDRQAKSSYEIVNVFQAFDATIGNLANLFLGELDRPAHPTQALISDSLSTSLAAHLLRSYNAFDIQTHHISKLGPRVLSNVIAYIEDHTGTTIRLDELANIAGVSRFHFSRLFKSSVGISPMAYVEQSRIRKAQQLIQSGKATLAEIALMAGFADQSHFTRRFQIHTGCTPAVFARHHGKRMVSY